MVSCSSEVKKEVKPIIKLDCLTDRNSYQRVEVDLEGGNWRYLASMPDGKDEIGKIFSSNEDYIIFSYYHPDDDTWNSYYFLNRSTLNIYVTSNNKSELNDLPKDEVQDSYNLIFECELAVPKV